MQQFDLPHEWAPCAVCGSEEAVLRHKIGDPARRRVYVAGQVGLVVGDEHIVRCTQCGLCYVNPRLVSQSGVRTYTPEEEDSYFCATRAVRQAGNRQLLVKLERILGGPARLLDVGCGDGALLIEALDRGWRCAGVEPSERLVARLRAAAPPVELFPGILEDARYADDAFDVVTLINVLEHVRHPASVLAEAARVVTRGGIVAVHVPNVGAMEARLRGSAWRHYEPLEHLHYFDRRTLSLLLERCGLQVMGPFALGGGTGLLHRLLVLGESVALHLANSLGLLARKAGG